LIEIAAAGLLVGFAVAFAEHVKEAHQRGRDRLYYARLRDEQRRHQLDDQHSQRIVP
jgi:hypothetical protein